MSRDLTQYPDRVYMAEIEETLERGRSTVRTWEAKGWLPETLKFHLDEAGWRYWTREQLEEAKLWVKARKSGPRLRHQLSPKKNPKKSTAKSST
jgi:hypothetical protein